MDIRTKHVATIRWITADAARRLGYRLAASHSAGLWALEDDHEALITTLPAARSVAGAQAAAEQHLHVVTGHRWRRLTGRCSYALLLDIPTATPPHGILAVDVDGHGAEHPAEA